MKRQKIVIASLAAALAAALVALTAAATTHTAAPEYVAMWVRERTSNVAGHEIYRLRSDGQVERYLAEHRAWVRVDKPAGRP